MLSLAPGANLVTWTGPEGTPLSDALAPIAPDLRVAFLYRPGADRYEAWAPGLPGADDPRLGFGQPLWLMVDRAVAWPVPAANAPPAVTSPQAASGSVVFIDAGREGSGFVIEDNLVVTAAHIVRGRREVRVRFPTGDEVSAAVVAADAPLDVALLSVPRVPDGTPRLAWLTGAQPALAEAVWLWGYPLGDPFGASTQPTVALGIVSAFQHNARGFPVIQTDAASAPGNSGGPLLDEGGRVIGVLISFVTRQGQDVEGINLTADVGANAGRLRELLARAWPDALAN